MSKSLIILFLAKFEMAIPKNGWGSRHGFFMFFVVLLMGRPTTAQTLSTSKINQAAEEKMPVALNDLIAFLKLPNDGHHEDEVLQNLKWCDSVFKAIDFTTQVVPTTAAPLLFAEKKVSPKLKTVLFYLQIDGQPVDQSRWDQPDAFLPVLKEKGPDGVWRLVEYHSNLPLDDDWRVFARSASDSKGPAMALIAALQVLRHKNMVPAFNVKVIMDFQEEMGSPSLPEAVNVNSHLLSADFLFIMDGTRHLSNLPTLTFGARGIATATIRFFGPKVALHSGQYGNFAPNPVFEAAKLLGGVKDGNGRVTLDGFYDGIVISAEEMELLNNVPEDLDSIKRTLGIANVEAIGGSYQESLQYPSLNIRGLRAAWVGDEVRTIIPDEVIAEIDMRLVPESDGDQLMQKLQAYLVANGYHLVDQEPTDSERVKYPKLAAFSYRLGSKPFRTDMDSPVGKHLQKVMHKAFSERFVAMRTTGGSQPIAPFITTLGIPAVSIRIPNPDNNIHGPNENLRVGNFREGIITCLTLLLEPLPL